MSTLYPHAPRTLRGGRLIKTALGVVSFAAVTGAVMMAGPGMAQEVGDPLDCLTGTYGRDGEGGTPFSGGLCAFTSTESDTYDEVGVHVSRDGSVIAVFSYPVRDRTGETTVSIYALDGSNTLQLSESDIPSRGSFQSYVNRFGYHLSQNRHPGVLLTPDGQHMLLLDGLILDRQSGTTISVGDRDGDDPYQIISTAISDDGRVVIGDYAWVAADRSRKERRMYRWTADGGRQDLGSLGGPVGRYIGFGFYLGAEAMSSDGSVVVGTAASNDTDLGAEAFRWTEDGGMQGLGAPDHINGFSASAATHVSEDGSVVVGRWSSASGSPYSNGENRAFRWTESGGMVDLGLIDDNDLEDDWQRSEAGSLATAMDRTGDVIVGTAMARVSTNLSPYRRSSPPVPRWTAFRWTEAGGMHSLGGLFEGARSRANDVSADGSVVIGFSEYAVDSLWGSIRQRAFRWTEETGMVNLGTLGDDENASSQAIAVSDNGSTIVGRSAGRAFIWRTEMQDLTNLYASLPLLARDVTLSAEAQQASTARMMDATCTADAGRNCIAATGWHTRTAEDGDLGDRNRSAVALTFGHGVSANLTVGGTVTVGGTSLTSPAIDMRRGLGGALWADWRAHQDGTGAQINAAIAMDHESGEILRGRMLDNLMLATGDADFTTKSAQLSFGYGLKAGGWTLTPSAKLERHVTERSGHTETYADFAGSFEDNTAARTTATLALDAAYPVSAKGQLELGAGVARDLSVTEPKLVGAIDLMNTEAINLGIGTERNETRGFVSVGYSHDLSANSTLSGAVQLSEAAYGDKPETTVSVRLGVTF